MDLIQDQRWTSISQVEDTGPLRPPGVAMDPITVDILEPKKNNPKKYPKSSGVAKMSTGWLILTDFN